MESVESTAEANRRRHPGFSSCNVLAGGPGSLAERSAKEASRVARLEQYGLVRIRQLLQPATEYDGWRINQRPPQVGDVGTLLDILHVPGRPDRYVVEASGAGGLTVWLADFSAEELELLDP